MTSARPITIGAICGSLRKASWNRALMNAAIELSPPAVSFCEIEIGNLPFFNADVEAQGDPEPVAKFKQAVRSVDGLLIVSPEYHRSVSGVLKNALDWGGRDPKGKGIITAPFAFKPVGITGTGGPLGTLSMQMHLRNILAEMRSPVMVQPHLFVTLARTRFDEKTLKLSDEMTRNQMTDFMKALADWVRQMAR